MTVYVNADASYTLPGTLPNPDAQSINAGGLASLAIGTSQLIGSPLLVRNYTISPAFPSKGEAVAAQLQSLLSTIATLLLHFYLIPAIRGFDNLTYETWLDTEPDDITAAGGSDKQAALIANSVASHPELTEEISERLHTILQTSNRLGFRMSQGQIGNEMTGNRRSINLINEAFGLNQLVGPLLWLSKVPNGSVIGFEEPEIHLHPRAQAALCDVLVDIATHEQKQLILTTHSEHILMALLTAVAKGQLKPDDLAVYEFHREGDTARAERLEVNEYGQVAGGLKGFLEVDMDEIGELIEARFRS